MDFTAILHWFEIESEKMIANLNMAITITVIALIGWVAYIVARRWLAKLIVRIAGKVGSKWEGLLFDRRFFHRLALLIVPIIIQSACASIAWQCPVAIVKIVNVWITFASVILVSSILDGVNRIYNSYPVSRNRPIKVFLQVIMIVFYLCAIMVAIQIFTGKDMTVLFTGLTAFAAVLMLVFKDTILGFVAGIQLAANDMLHIGDRIVMPSTNADGDVTEINLTTVKVHNSDKTITTIPTYKLVEQSFTNWRGLEEAAGRLIKRSVNIDISSIHHLAEEDLKVLKESSLLKKYIEEKEKELGEFNVSYGYLLDGQQMTNVGTFREYMELWLKNNPNINSNMTCMVRQLQPGATGLPLEIYCFSANKKSIKYEQVQADVFDHVYAIMRLFNLRAFQYSGTMPPHSA